MKIVTLLVIAIGVAIAQADETPSRRLRKVMVAPTKMEGQHDHWYHPNPKMDARMPRNAQMEGQHLIMKRHAIFDDDPKMQAAAKKTKAPTVPPTTAPPSPRR